MNLTDIDLTKATPIDFDDIREGDTFVYADDCEVVIANAVRKGATMVGGGWIATGPHEEDRHFYADPEAYWFLLDRPSPPSPEPGTTGTATVRGVPGVRVIAFNYRDDSEPAYFSPDPVDGNRIHFATHVTDFVADPAPGIPQEIASAIAEMREATREATVPTIARFLRAVDAYEARDV